MKKIFSFFVVALFAVSAMATKVTFDFTNPSSLGITPATEASSGVDLYNQEFTVGDVTIGFDTVALGGDKANVNKQKLWTNTGDKYELRLYKNNLVNLTATKEGDKIECIEFTGTIGSNIEGVENRMWLGEAASSVQLKLPATATTTKVNTITVYLNEKPELWTPDTLSVTEARKLIADNDPLKDKPHYVKGIVSSEPYINFGTGCIWICDLVNKQDTLEGFKIDQKKGVAFTAETLAATVALGDTVLLYADGLSLYGAIYETLSGYLAAVYAGARTELEITRGMALYDKGYGELAFELETSLGKMELVFEHENANAIAGSYALGNAVELTIGGQKVTATGSLVVAYDAESEKYDVRLSMVKDDVKYVGAAKLALGDFADDKPFVVPPMPEGCLTAAEAQAEGLKLETPADGKTTYGAEVVVRGFVTFCYDAKTSDKTGRYCQSAWLADDATAKSGLVQAYYATVEQGKEVKVGDYVEVRGQLAHYRQVDKNDKTKVESVIEITDPKGGVCTMKRVKDLSEGIFNMNEDVKVMKTVINGQVVIIRGEKMYNMMGAEL